jgi:hypothetical protein
MSAADRPAYPKLSALLKRWSAPGAVLSEMEQMQLRALANMNRNGAICYQCEQAMDLAAGYVFILGPIAEQYCAVSVCKRCRRKMDADGKFEAAVHARMKMHAARACLPMGEPQGNA